jgi:hypothetical protein
MEQEKRRSDWSEGLSKTRQKRLGELAADATTQLAEIEGDIPSETYEARLRARFGEYVTQRVRLYDGI